jgi:hypothetical protein
VPEEQKAETDVQSQRERPRFAAWVRGEDGDVRVEVGRPGRAPEISPVSTARSSEKSIHS